MLERTDGHLELKCRFATKIDPLDIVFGTPNTQIIVKASFRKSTQR